MRLSHRCIAEQLRIPAIGEAGATPPPRLLRQYPKHDAPVFRAAKLGAVVGDRLAFTVAASRKHVRHAAVDQIAANDFGASLREGKVVRFRPEAIRVSGHLYRQIRIHS